MQTSTGKSWYVILQQEELESFTSEVEIAVYRAIKSYLANGKQIKALSIREIQARTLVSIGTVFTTIPKLIKLGKIKIVGEESKLGGKIPIYQVCVKCEPTSQLPTNNATRLGVRTADTLPKNTARLGVQPLNTLSDTLPNNATRLSVQLLNESVQSSGTKTLQRNKGISLKREEEVVDSITPGDLKGGNREKEKSQLFSKRNGKNLVIGKDFMDGKPAGIKEGQERKTSVFSPGNVYFEEIRKWEDEIRKIPIADICQKLGFKISKDGKVPCHDEDTASCDVGPKRKSVKFYCFGCGAKGGSIDFLMLKEKLDFSKACDRLASFFGIPKPRKQREEYPHVFPQEYVDYLKHHGLTTEEFGRFGFYSEKYGGSAAIKVKTGTKFRTLKADSKVKYYNDKSTTICVFKTMPKADVVYLCEGEIDAISLYSNTGFASCSLICGAQTFPDELVSEFDDVKKVYICYDNDEAGRKGTELVVEKLGIFKTRIVSLPSKDISEYFASGKTRDDFEKLIEEIKEPYYSGLKFVSADVHY